MLYESQTELCQNKLVSGERVPTVQTIRKTRIRRKHIFGGRAESSAANLGAVGVMHNVSLTGKCQSIRGPLVI